MLSQDSLSQDNMQRQRDLHVLEEIEENPVLTQRSLSTKLGMALGLTNLYIKRLAHKGYIKITTFPKGRVKYLITPRGIAEKSRLTCEYIQYSLHYFRDVRQRFDRVLIQLKQLGVESIVVFGSGELAEMAYLSLQGTQFKFLGFVSETPEKTFLSCPCHTVNSLKSFNFDAVLICNIGDVEGTKALLRDAGIPQQKVFTVV